MSRRGKNGVMPAAAHEERGHDAKAQGAPGSRELVQRLQKLISQEPALVAKMLERFLREDR